jgi:hypothetical protein
MKLITADFETFWSTTHTLSKMSPIEYVMHPETEIISVAIKVDNEGSTVAYGPNVESALREIDWDDAFAIGHNMSGFDSMILAWRYGIRPRMWGCTLAMARYLGHAKTTGLSLKALLEFYGLGVKDNTALINTRGKHFDDLTIPELTAMGVYNMGDTDGCYKLFKRLGGRVPTRELKLIDTTIRMLVEPRFELDKKLLSKALVEEQERKRLMLLDVATMIGAYEPGQTDEETATIASKMLASSSKFSEILRACGVEVPMKPSPSNPEKMTPALAKTDEAFLALQDHKDPIIATAAQARLGVKSTILESRIMRFLESEVDGKLPVFLNFYGADTTGRWSGGGNLNQQNLTRVDPKKPKPTDALRQSLRAPKGHKIVVADLSGIELRVNHFLWQVPSSMALYQADPEKADLYKDFASMLYEIAVEEVTKNQRQVGKVAHLGLGFGAGHVTFQKVAKNQGGVDLTLGEAKEIVNMWRAAYSEIAEGWKTCHAALPMIFGGYEQEIDPWGLCHTCEEGIKTPQGMIRYPNLREDYVANGLNPDGSVKYKKEWIYGDGRSKARIYAGKIDENIVQHLAREAIADNCLEIKKTTGFESALLVHDEWVGVVPESVADDVLEEVQRIMRTPPKWWPELVVWSEGSIGDTYAEAK